MSDFPERCACSESEWLRGLLASILGASSESELQDAMSGAASALRDEGASAPGEE